MTRRRFAHISIVDAVGLVVGFGGRIAAAIPSGNTIHACYRNDSGVLRAIDPSVGDVCNPSETALDWAQIGQQGVQGIQGLRGAQGSNGRCGYRWRLELSDRVSPDGNHRVRLLLADERGRSERHVPDRDGAGGNRLRSSVDPSEAVRDARVQQAEPYELYVMGDPNVTVTAYAVCVDQQFEGK